MSAVLGAQIGTALILGIGSLLCGNLPVLIIRYISKKSGRSNFNIFHNKSSFGSKVLSFLMCFGGGVLFATCFVHLIPEVQERFEEKGGGHHHHDDDDDDHDHDGDITTMTTMTGAPPEEHHHHHHDLTGFLVISAGFFLVFAIEEILHLFLAHHHHHGDVSDEKPPRPRRRTVSCISDEFRASGEFVTERYTRRTTSLSPVQEESNVAVDGKPLSSVNSSNSNKDRRASSMTVNVAKITESSGSQGGYKRHTDVEESAGSFSEVTIEDEPTNVVNMVRGLMIVVALSFHSVFEGLAVGLQKSSSYIWTTGMAIAVHKFVIAFVVGLEVYSQTLRPKIVVIYLTAFSLMSPIGIMIAIATTSGGDNVAHGMAADVLNAIAAGTIVYVVFFEILQRERHVSLPGIYQLIAVASGYGLMVGIQMATQKYHVD